MVLKSLISMLALSWASVSFARSYDLDLILAEKMALSKESSRSVYEKEREIASYSITEKNLSLLPSLSASTGFNSNFKGPLKPDLAFSLKQVIPNPFQWSAEKKALLFEERSTVEKLEKRDLEVLEKLRKAYFKVQTLRKKIANANKNLELLASLEKKSQNRFQTGSLASYDLKRVLIKKRQVESRLRELRKGVHLCEEIIKVSLGLEDADVFTLSDSSKELDLSDVKEALLTDLVRLSKNSELRGFELQYQKKEEEAFGKSFFYMPDLSLEARYGLESQFTLQANLTWKIFSGGTSYFKHRKSLAEKEKSYFTFLDKKEEIQLKSRELIFELLTLKEDYKSEKQTLEDAKAIFQSSQERFQSGTLSSQDLSSDFSFYTNQENHFLEIRLKILELLCEFGTLVSNKGFLEGVFR